MDCFLLLCFTDLENASWAAIKAKVLKAQTILSNYFNLVSAPQWPIKSENLFYNPHDAFYEEEKKYRFNLDNIQ